MPQVAIEKSCECPATISTLHQSVSNSLNDWGVVILTVEKNTYNLTVFAMLYYITHEIDELPA